MQNRPLTRIELSFDVTKQFEAFLLNNCQVTGDVRKEGMEKHSLQPTQAPTVSHRKVTRRSVELRSAYRETPD